MSSHEICSDFILPKQQPECPRHVLLSRRNRLRMYGLVLSLVETNKVRVQVCDPRRGLTWNSSTANQGLDDVVEEIKALHRSDLLIVSDSVPA
jgi:hypothetical protein